jgi:sulfate-transporting ATPase
MPGLKIGYLPQEPQLDPEQTVREAVEQGIGGVLAAKKRLDEVYAEYAEPDADFDKLAAEQAELEAIIAAAGSENTDLQLELAADALRLPPWDAKIGTCPAARSAAWRCAGCCCPSPTCCCSTSPPTTWTPSRGVAGAVPAALPRHRGGHHPRPLLPGQRGRVDPRTRPRQGIPWKGNYSDWLDQKEKRLEVEQKKEDARMKAMKEELKWVRSNAKGRQAKSKARLARFEELSDVEYQRATRPTRSSSRWPSAWATR